MEPVVQVYLKKGEDRRIKQGHPWVFSNQVSQVEKVDPGTIAVFRDSGGSILGHGVVNPHSLIYGRIYTRRTSSASFGEPDVRMALERALRERQHFTRQSLSHRAVFGEADHLGGLVVDRYYDADLKQVLAVQFHSAGAEQVFVKYRHVFNEVLGDSHSVIVHRSAMSRLKEGLEVKPTEVLEGSSEGLENFSARVAHSKVGLTANLLKGQKTGLFLDQSANINLAVSAILSGPEIPGKIIKILDICSYVGAWGVSLGEALRANGRDVEVHFVDVSAQALQTASMNAKARSLPHVVHEVDFLGQELSSLGLESQFDIVVLDLPSMVKNKKVLPQARHGYRKANRSAMKCLKKSGLQWYFSASCSQLVSRSDFDEDLAIAAQSAELDGLNLFVRGGHSADHPVRTWYPEGEYLKFRGGYITRSS